MSWYDQFPECNPDLRKARDYPRDDAAIDREKIAMDHVKAVAGQYNRLRRHLAKDEQASDISKVEKLLDLTLDAMVTDLRKREPNLTKEQAFSKVYCAPENVELRRIERGISYRKMDATFVVAQTSPQILNEASVNIERGTSAYDELMKIARDERRRNPYNASLETIEQAFARVYAAPENRPLATRERAERMQQIAQGQGVQFAR